MYCCFVNITGRITMIFVLNAWLILLKWIANSDQMNSHYHFRMKLIGLIKLDGG